MFGLRSLFRGLTVEERGDEIIVDGVDGNSIVRDINKHWKTTRITKNFFTSMSRRRLSFYKFFAPEFTYLLDGISQYRNRFTSIKMINELKSKMYTDTWLRDVDREGLKGRLDFNRLKNMTFTPEDYQMAYFKDYDLRLNRYNLKGDLMDASTGTGKAQPLDSMIKVPGGWRRMGDIQVGDSVIAWDGTTTKVNGVFPQGRKQTFTITFADGRTVEACDEHLWRVYHVDWRRYRGGDGWRILTTMELFGYMQMKAISNRLYVQLCESEDSPEADLPIHPYNMGVILGDGGVSSGTVDISCSDSEVIERFGRHLPNNLKTIDRDGVTHSVIRTKKARRTKNKQPHYLNHLRDLELMGCKAETKFIPEIYLKASTEQRWELLRGLMDTDGYVDSYSSMEYSTSSYRLAKDFQYLVRSLGGVAKITSKIPYYTYKGVRKAGQVSYWIHMRLKQPSLAFHLSRKKERCNDEGQYTGETLRLKVKHVNLSDRVECQCISIEHPDHLYITDDFIVTHNTFMGTALAEMLAGELIVIIVPKETLELVWIPSIDEMYRTKQSVWSSRVVKEYNGERFVICHYEALGKLLEQFKANPKYYQGKEIVTIVDECHNLNDVNSQRTQTYLELVRLLDSNNNILSSGTPVKAMGVELITMLRVVDPLFTPNVERAFRAMYGHTASKGLDIIKFRMGLVSYRIEKSVLELEKPLLHEHPIKIPNGKDYTLPAIKEVMREYIKERLEYYKRRKSEDESFWREVINIHSNALRSSRERDLFKEYMRCLKLVIACPGFYGAVKDEIKFTNLYEKRNIEPTLPRTHIKRFRDVKSVIKYVDLKIQGECLGNVLGRKRIECHVDMAPYVDWVGIIESTTKKTIMFTSFVEALTASGAHLMKIGLKPLSVYGANKNEMVSTVAHFEKDPKANPLLATYASLSTGVRLVMADTIILLNSPFRQYILDQAVARAYRKGQDSRVMVYKVTLDTGDVPNISTRSDDILQWSAEQVAAMLGIQNTLETAETIAVEDFKFDMVLKDIPDEETLMMRSINGLTDPLNETFSKEHFMVPETINQSHVPVYLR